MTMGKNDNLALYKRKISNLNESSIKGAKTD